MTILREATTGAHHCEMPRAEFRDKATGETVTGMLDMREIYYWPGAGTVYQCDKCEAIWIAYRDPGYVSRGRRGRGGYVKCASIEWRRATAKEEKELAPAPEIEADSAWLDTIVGSGTDEPKRWWRR